MIHRGQMDEAGRLAALREYRAMDTPPEACFDRVSRAVAHLLKTPFAFLTLVDEERAFVKSSHGAGVGFVPRDATFCTHVVTSGGPMIVRDATVDPRFTNNRFVTGSPGIRFYAGVPLVTPSGFCIGSVCGVDLIPRPEGITDEQLSFLRDLAAGAMDQIEHRLAKSRAEEYAAALELREREFRAALSRCDRSEARASLALEAGGMGHWEWDAAADRISWSPKMEQILGMTPGTFDGTRESWLKQIYAADRARVSRELLRNQQAKAPFLLKYRVLGANGEVVWISEKGAYEIDRSGRILGASGIAWDSTERERWLAGLRANEELFRGLSLSCPAGIFKATLEGNVTYVNPTTAAIWGMRESELEGFGWLERVHPEDRAALVEQWLAANAVRQSFDHEYRLLMPSGDIRWVHGRSAIVRGDSCDSVVGTVDDITQRKEAAAAMELAKAEAEAANRAKDLFLANVSHELRTPLNGILGMTELLLQAPLDVKQRECAEMVQRSGQTLLSLVSDLLDTGKIGAGTLTIATAPFDLRSTIAISVDYVRQEAERKDLAISVQIADKLPARLLGDSSRIQQIVLNFLTNAVKFTESGGVRCDVHCQALTDALHAITIEVRDTGLGIAPEKQAKLFQPFSQVDDSSTRKQRGVGLGLAICKQLAELMGGSVGLESTPGAGSTFWLKLALPTVAPESAIEQVSVEVSPDTPLEEIERGRILVAEDNLINQRVVTRMLERLGWEVDVAADGVRAFALAKQNPYALVLMDCLMPEADGYTTTAMIRDHEHSNGLPRLPIVALTANALSGDRERCLECGMDDYLSKPLQLHLLRQVLERWNLRPSAVEFTVCK